MPRLLYWNKLTGLDQPSTMKSMGAKIQTWHDSSYWANANTNSSGSTLPKIYPQATSINRNDSTSPVLSYGNVYVRDYTASSNTFSEYVIGKGLYETYYRAMMEMLKENPRVRTSYIDLKTKDIVNLDFTKLIYIDDCYWRINKIIDYMPNANSPTKVELILWIETGTFALKEPDFGSSGGWQWGTPVDEDVVDEELTPDNA